MRHVIAAGLLVALPLALPAAAEAQQRKVKIEQVRIGFPGGGEGEAGFRSRNDLFKPGAWTPVYVKISPGDSLIQKGEVVIETNDSDDVPTNYTVPLPPLDPNDPDPQKTVIAYTKPGSVNPTITVTVQTPNQTVTAKGDYGTLELGHSLYLALGSRLAGMRTAARKQAKRPPRFNVPNAAGQEEAEDGRQAVAYLTNVADLPTRWFGYAPVDLMVLTTGNHDFVTDLISPAETARQEALGEWVRRGGHLVISAGRNHQLTPELLKRLRLALPVTVTGPDPRPEVPEVLQWLRENPAEGQNEVPPFKNQPLKNGEVPPVTVAKLEVVPGRPMEPVVPFPWKEGAPLLVVRAPQGLGQVTLVAFDLDAPPFTTWGGQEAFWTTLLRRVGPPPPNPSPTPQPQFRFGGQTEEVNDVAGALQSYLEQFDDIPVISFGWVALFIFVYILIVGPLDYFFLKKVVKRLELTWVTFPAVVLVVSAVAYFAAYSLKGNDQKINKVDLVDIDLPGGQTYGTTWFSIFSPRIQNYTVGVEPAAPLWAAAPAEGTRPSSSLVSWLGRPDNSFGGYGRGHSQGLFRRAYDYATDAAGLKGVPIQVWSSKSFTASWERPSGPNPPITASLRHVRGKVQIQGTITSRPGNPGKGDELLKVEDAVLIYSGGPDQQIKVYPLGTLAPGADLKFDSEDRKESLELSGWVPTLYLGNPGANRGYQGSSPPQLPREMLLRQTDGLMKQLLFQDPAPNRGATNYTLSYLNQYWRLKSKDEAVLFGRLTRVKGPAEGVSQGGSSPSRLWLGSLPGSGQRSPLSGELAQDTYVRVFIPVSNPWAPLP
jgi:hypothetical protein